MCYWGTIYIYTGWTESLDTSRNLVVIFNNVFKHHSNAKFDVLCEFPINKIEILPISVRHIHWLYYVLSDDSYCTWSCRTLFSFGIVRKVVKNSKNKQCRGTCFTIYARIPENRTQHLFFPQPHYTIFLFTRFLKGKWFACSEILLISSLKKNKVSPLTAQSSVKHLFSGQQPSAYSETVFFPNNTDSFLWITCFRAKQFRVNWEAVICRH